MPFDEATEENWDRNVDINLKGVFFLIQAAVPQMRAQGGGRIVNITSIAASQGFANAAGLLRGEGRAPQPHAARWRWQLAPDKHQRELGGDPASSARR